MVAKVGLGVIGLGAISIGSVAFTKPEWLGINKEILWTPLSKDHSFASSSSYGESTFGGKYKGVLTGVVGTDSAAGATNTNGDWWNKSFEQLKADSEGSTVSDKFKYDSDENKSKVSKGTSDDASGKGLNQICNEAYKQDPGKITSAGGNDNYKEADVWKYCSPIGSKPTTISDSDSGTYTTSGWIGENSTNKTKLVSTTGNVKFWELRNKEFKGIGKYQKIEETKDAFFDPDKGKSIKDLCEDAYKQTATNGTSSKTAPTSAQALKYCSINKE